MAEPTVHTFIAGRREIEIHTVLAASLIIEGELMSQEPLIAKSDLTGNVYAVTEYEILEGGVIAAETKHDVGAQIEALVARGAVGDGFHTMPELYDWRLIMHALLVNTMHRDSRNVAGGYAHTVKSWRHSDGRYPFGDKPKEWFVVVTELSQEGQVSNHYRAEHWDKFTVPEVEKAPAFDGHTDEQALQRWTDFLERRFDGLPVF